MDADNLWDMSDEELEASFKAAKSQEYSPDTELEQESPQDDESPDEDLDSNEDENENEDEELDSSDNSDEEDNGSEQPKDDLEDSDHDTSDESEDEDLDEENAQEAEEESPDNDSEDAKSENSDKSETNNDEAQPAQQYKFRANGKDYEFSSEEIVKEFPNIFGKAMDYTKKMQSIKPWRKTIDAIEEAKISHEDIGLVIDVLKGDKEAIAEVLKRTGVDTLELNTEEGSNYVAKDYGRDEKTLAISDIVSEISGDVEYATTQKILSNQWDEKSWEAVNNDPEIIRLLHADVKNGMYNKIQPIAEKLKVYGGVGKSDLDYYIEAAKQHFKDVDSKKAALEAERAREAKILEDSKEKKDLEEKRERLEKAKQQSSKRESVNKAAEKRKAAAPNKSTPSNSVTDYLDASDEDFDEWYKQLEDSL